MRLLFTTDQYYLPQRFGGGERSLHELALALQEKGHVVAVYCALRELGWVGFRNRVGRKILGEGKSPADHGMGYPVYRGWDVLEGVDEVVDRFKPSVVIAQPSTAVYLAGAFVKHDVPTLLYLRDVFFEEKPWVRSDPRLGYLAISPFVARRVKEFAGVEATVIQAIIRPESYLVESTRRRLLFINPIAIKGVDIATQLAKMRPDIPFDIVECWPLTAEALAAIQGRLRGFRNVRYHAPMDDIREVYREAKVLLFPSICNEAAGRCVTEAQLSGIPVLASNRGGLPESVGPGGITLDPAAPIEVWADALGKLWEDDVIYAEYSREAFAHARRKEIDPNTLRDRFIEVVERHVAQWPAVSASGPRA